MLGNLAQLSPWVWIAAIAVIVVVTGLIIWARRRKFRISKITVKTGLAEAELTPGEEKKASAATSPPPSVNISGVKMFGKRNKIAVRRDNTNISDSTLVGDDHEIEVGAKPGPKPTAKKGKQSK